MSVGDVAPLARTKATRLRAVRARLDRSGGPLFAAAQWWQSFPEGLLSDEVIISFEEATSAAIVASNVAVASLRPERGVDPMKPHFFMSEHEHEAQLLESESGLANAIKAVNAFLGALRKVINMMPAVEAKRAALGYGNRNESAKVAMALQQTAALTMIDAGWLSTVAARLVSRGLDPAAQTAYRSTKYRRRKREKFASVTTSYHEKDLDLLRLLGFLNGAGEPEETEVAAAFEAFQQAAISAALAGIEGAEPAVYGQWLGSWADRMAALDRIDRG